MLLNNQNLERKATDEWAKEKTDGREEGINPRRAGESREDIEARLLEAAEKERDFNSEKSILAEDSVAAKLAQSAPNEAIRRT